MSILPHRHSASPVEDSHFEPVAGEHFLSNEEPAEFSAASWESAHEEQPGRADRRVLGSALVLLAMAWIGYAGWQAGRTLGGEPLSSPMVAQWIAILTGPLALFGLVWIMFGRTRRKEAERFTRSVVAMRHETTALQDVLAAMSTQIERNHAALGQMSGELMSLGDQAQGRLGAITADLNSGAATLAQHGAALDRAAEAARTDIGVLLADLPEAEAVALRMAETLRGAGIAASDQATRFADQVQAIAQAASAAHGSVGDAADRFVAQLGQIEGAAAAAATRLADVGGTSNDMVDALLARSADALDSLRQGIDLQAAAVTALLQQSEAGMNRAGQEAASQLRARVDESSSLVDQLQSRIEEQESAHRRMLTEVERGLGLLGGELDQFATAGDERAGRILGTLSQVRGEIASLGSDAGAHDQALLAIADRTSALRDHVGALGKAIAGELGAVISDAECGAGRLYDKAAAAHPLLVETQASAKDASDRIEASGRALAMQRDTLEALHATIADSSDASARRLADLSAAIATARDDAERLSAESAPALVAALVQVREAAGHAADRAREAITAAIPRIAGNLGDSARAALDKAVREAVDERLAEIDRVAAGALATTRAVSEQLSGQVLAIGAHASALDHHLAAVREAARRDAGEGFSRQVELLIDSMHSASIDVQKILSDEVDEKAWGQYQKGQRGVFTRRAVRLIGNSEARGLQSHYDQDPEFRQSVNQFVADFEAMLRRVMDEREGGMLAVTLLGSDIGKLYAALTGTVERRR